MEIMAVLAAAVLMQEAAEALGTLLPQLLRRDQTEAMEAPALPVAPQIMGLVVVAARLLLAAQEQG
jgi:hypothetical protein